MSKTDNANDKEEPTVYLGYIEDGDEIVSELAENSVDLPVDTPSTSKEKDENYPWLINKIGGLPIFPGNIPDVEKLEVALESMKCKHCKSACVLILQIVSPIDDSPVDRVMQMYTCVRNDCVKHSWFAMRCMFSRSNYNQCPSTVVNSRMLNSHQDPTFGQVLICRERAFFKPYYLSVMEEPTGRENFVRDNLAAMKLASSFRDPDDKPAPIEEKYKNLKNYQPPKPPAHLCDLDDFEKFQLERLYKNDKDMYRFYKRIGRFQAQICRYDWEGKPLLNSMKIKLNIHNCPSCSSKRKFEFQLMSALINYLKSDQDFDRESLDFSSVIVHSCSRNCTTSTYHIEDTYFMPDPDSRIFNKLKQKMLAVKLSDQGDTPADGDLDETDEQPVESKQTSGAKKKRNKKNKKK